MRLGIWAAGYVAQNGSRNLEAFDELFDCPLVLRRRNAAPKEFSSVSCSISPHPEGSNQGWPIRASYCTREASSGLRCTVVELVSFRNLCDRGPLCTREVSLTSGKLCCQWWSRTSLTTRDYGATMPKGSLLGFRLALSSAVKIPSFSNPRLSPGLAEREPPFTFPFLLRHDGWVGSVVFEHAAMDDECVSSIQSAVCECG